jgi:exosortase/archaeosortase family protein
VGKFVACWLAFTNLVGFLPQIETYTVRATAWTLGKLLRLVPVSSGTGGADLVYAGPILFQIVTECTSLMPTLILWSAILAFPAPWRLRASGLILVAAGLWIYNLIRLLGLFVVKALWPTAYDAVHVYLWQTTTLAVVFAFFFLWLRMNLKVAPARTS